MSVTWDNDNILELVIQYELASENIMFQMLIHGLNVNLVKKNSSLKDGGTHFFFFFNF